jgi:hypothetical protein
VTFWSVDGAGNAETPHTATVLIDRTPPSIAWNGGPTEGKTYAFGSVPGAPQCIATDAHPGTPCTVSGYSTTVGSHTMTAKATDAAGNVATATRTYKVEAWTLKGFYQPVDMGSVINTVKGGSTVPLKFEVLAGATKLTDAKAIQSFTARPISCSSTMATDAVDNSGTAIGTSLTYDGNQFHQNWQTPKNPDSCYRVTVTTSDGSSISALFKLK